MGNTNPFRRSIDQPARRCSQIIALLSPRERRSAAVKLQTPNRLLCEDGSSIVETALSAMIVLTLFFGIMQMSLALYMYHFTSEAAREGTRYAMVRGCSVISAACPVSVKGTDVQNYVRGLGFPGVLPANITVTTKWPTTGATCKPSSIPCNNPGNLVKVTVQYRLPLSIPFVPSTTLNLASTSQMAISQ